MLKNQANSLEDFIDGGSTQALVNQVQEHKSDGAVKNALLAASPFVSDIVLLTFINKNKPYAPGIIKDVILANSSVSDTVLTALLNRIPALPPGILNQILAAQTGISARDTLESSINFLLGERELALGAVIRNFTHNDSLPGALDSIIALLGAENRVETEMMLVSVYLENNDTANAQLLIDSMAQIPELANFAALQQLFIDAGDTLIEAIENDSLTKSLVELIAAETTKPGSMEARVLLSLVFGIPIPEIFVFPTQQQLKTGNTDDNNVTKKELIQYSDTSISGEYEGHTLENHPNPFSEGTIITAYVPAHFSISEIMIYDVIGNVVKRITLDKGYNSINIDGKDIKHGIYFYSLISNHRKIATKRMIFIE